MSMPSDTSGAFAGNSVSYSTFLGVFFALARIPGSVEWLLSNRRQSAAIEVELDAVV